MGKAAVIFFLTFIALIGAGAVIVTIGVATFSERLQPEAFRELTRADIDAHMVDIMAKRSPLATEHGRKSYVLGIARQVEPVVEFNTSRADECNRWIEYGQYQLELITNTLAPYTPPAGADSAALLDWATKTIPEEDLRRMAAYTAAAVEMGNRAYACFTE